MKPQIQWLILVFVSALAVACGSDDEGNNGNNDNNQNNTNNVADMGNNATNNDVGSNQNNTNNNQNNMVDMGPDVPLGPERLPTTFSVLPPVPSSCDNPGSLQRIPFMYNSSDVVPVVVGDVVNNQQVLPNITVDSGSIASRRSRISVEKAVTCIDDSECPSGFKCATAGLPGAQKQCTVQTGLEFIPNTVEADYDSGKGDRGQLVAVLMENTTSLTGRLPVASGSLFDENGETDLFQDTARATDLQRVNRDAVENFTLNLASVTDPRNTKVGIWFFAGQVQAEARPLVDPMALTDHFTNDLSIGGALLNELPEPAPKPGNVYQSMLKLIPNDFGLEQYADDEKFLVVFTDGPNEVYDDEAEYADVLQAMQDANIKVFIVHLDNSVDPDLIRDVPTLWAGNQMCQDDATCSGARTCASDSDCPNYAECRPATIYAETAMDPVMQTSQSYCMPSYDETGRIGPIDEYADLACRTGGNYIYVTDPEQMRRYFRIMPTAFDGQFSIEADFSAFSDPDVDPGFYRLSTTLLGLLGPNDLGSILSSPVDGAVSQDSRPILRLGRVRN